MTVALACGVAACTEPHELHVVKRGRWVELATDRDGPICGGTVAFFDRVIEQGFAFIGETPPDDVFVRYEWVDDVFAQDGDPIIGEGLTRIVDDGILIRSTELVHEHELAHAVHTEAWPVSARFLHEGFAILLDGHRPFDPGTWTGAELDDVLGGDLKGGEHYYEAWFLVSQIVRDHGVDGLREMFYAIPHGATAAQVRRAYADLFGRPIDVLLERRPFEGGVGDEARHTATFALCTGTEVPWNGDVWTASGPTACEGDPEAIGAYTRGDSVGLAWDGPPVWRDYVVEQTTSTQDYVTSPAITLNVSPCELQWWWGSREIVHPKGEDGSRELRPARYRVDVRTDLEDLPTNEPGTLQFIRPAE